MPAAFCPIFDEKLAFIGLWALDPATIQDTARVEADLRGLASPTLNALQKMSHRQVRNASVEVGNGVRFEGGTFMMVQDQRAPNEELGRPESTKAYLVIGYQGVSCLTRVERSDPRVKIPPAPPAPASERLDRVEPGAGNVPAADPRVGRGSEPRRNWWQFWK
jgi:hypothetical protein